MQVYNFFSTFFAALAGYGTKSNVFGQSEVRFDLTWTEGYHFYAEDNSSKMLLYTPIIENQYDLCDGDSGGALMVKGKFLSQFCNLEADLEADFVDLQICSKLVPLN